MLLVAPDAGVATRGVARVMGLSVIAALALFAWLGSRWFDPPPADVDMENVPAVELTK